MSCAVKQWPSSEHAAAPAGQRDRSAGMLPIGGVQNGRQTRPGRQSWSFVQRFKQRGSPLNATQLNPRSESPAGGGGGVVGPAGSKRSSLKLSPGPPVPAAPPVPLDPPVPAIPPAPPLPPVPTDPAAPPIPSVPAMPAAPPVPPMPSVPAIPAAPPEPPVPPAPVVPPVPVVPPALEMWHGERLERTTSSRWGVSSSWLSVAWTIS